MAILKNTTINDTGFLQLPVGTTAQRPAPTNGKLRFNSNTGKLEFYNAVINAWIGTPELGVVATGGLIYDVDTEGTTYRVHVFTTTGNSTFTVTKGGQVEYLIVAGGGGGGGINAGGGGGGGLLTGTIDVTSQSYTFTVGAGGLGGIGYQNGNNEHGSQGSNSSAFGLTSIGGGGGSAYSVTGTTAALGRNGGSGGGGGGGAVANSQAAGTGTAGQGNNGGAGLHRVSGFVAEGGGGGGGAESLGRPATEFRANGGIGLSSNITGLSIFYAGGGGGGFDTRGADRSGLGGLGGGGNGTYGTLAASNGALNTGGGGGAAGYNANSNARLGGTGGSGIVIIRYPLRQENPTINIPKIAGDGLVLDLDFAKPTVYAGIGTVVNDSRLNGITGTLVNGPVFTDARTHRSSFSFDGVDDYVNGSVGALNAPFTFEIFGKFNNSSQVNYEYFGSVGGFSADGMISISKIGTQDPNSSYHGFMYVYNGSGDAKKTNIDLRTTNYQHLVVVLLPSSPYIKLYKNGVEGSMVDALSAPINTNGNYRIGTWGNNTWWLNGNISKVSIYNRALTAQEILDNFNATRWRFGV